MAALFIACSTLLFLGTSAEVQQKPADGAAVAPAPGHWPQWRGATRDNISDEKGLLKTWPEGGPPCLWSAEGLGEGVGCLSIAGGLIFVLGYRNEQEFLTALDGSGRTVWSVAIGPSVKEMSVMRWLSQRTVTVDDDRLYAFTARGVLLCLQCRDGRSLWEKNYVKDFGGSSGPWGFCDFPIVDGERLICTPGGPKSAVVALNRKTGETLWQCPIPGVARNTYSGAVLGEIVGVRQALVQTESGAAGIDVKTGQLLWTFGEKSSMGNVHSAILWKENQVLCLNAWGLPSSMLEISPDGGRAKAVAKYQAKIKVAAWRASEVRRGDHLYCFDAGICLDLSKGEEVSRFQAPSGATVTWADGLFYVRGTKGQVRLMEVTPDSSRTASEFEEPHGNEPTWTFPVVAGGRLYLRDQGTLRCYDVRGPEYQEAPPVWRIPAVRQTRPERPVAPARTGAAKEPDAIFVATPQDVVDRMITLAGVGKDDVVYDLGSGDGRILIAASKARGCKSVGFEINPELVKESRLKVNQARLDDLVTIEEKDLFTADLSPATVVTLYLGAPNNARLLPQLEKLKPGSRVVSHEHLLGDSGPRPDETVRLTSKEDGIEHTIYLWKLPFKAEKPR